MLERHARSAAASCRRLAVACVLAVAVACPAGVWAAPAAPIAPDRVPVLLVDGGLGDTVHYSKYWLGAETPVAESGSVRLLTTKSPVWWTGEGAPDTYLLTGMAPDGASTAPLGVAEIAWALDRIAEVHPEARTLVVAQGASGLAAREYAQSVGDVRQKDRADLVGLVLFGTPNNGLALPETYPKAGVWQPFAAGAGLTGADLTPGSPYLARLDAGKLPAVLKTLVGEGAVAVFHGKQTDGVTVLGESRLASGVAAGPVDYVQLAACASQARPLQQDWAPYVNMVGGDPNELPANEVAKLGGFGYASSPEARSAVQTFYKAWFAQGAPTTHISSRLVMDVSGSMRDDIGAVTKLAGAQQAARGFVDALAARTALPTAIPEDVGLIVFNTEAKQAAAAGSGADKVARAISGLKADGNTDVGAALSEAAASFSTSPREAQRVVVFLSDGVNTAGLDEAAILAGPVADAAKANVKINAIALGAGLGEADTGFLREIAKRTGGTFTQARDVYQLRRDFLRARYASLGDLALDKEYPLKGAVTVPLATADTKTRMIEVGVVPDAAGAKWRLLRDGQPLPAGAARIAENDDGTLSVQVVTPATGAYTLQLADAGSATKAHVFAVSQQDAFAREMTAAVEDNTANMLLLGVGVFAVVGVAATVALSRKRPAPDPESHE